MERNRQRQINSNKPRIGIYTEFHYNWFILVHQTERYYTKPHRSQAKRRSLTVADARRGVPNRSELRDAYRPQSATVSDRHFASDVYSDATLRSVVEDKMPPPGISSIWSDMFARSSICSAWMDGPLIATLFHVDRWLRSLLNQLFRRLLASIFMSDFPRSSCILLQTFFSKVFRLSQCADGDGLFCIGYYTSLFTIMVASEKKNRKTDRTET